jgi:hypothetical protein
MMAHESGWSAGAKGALGVVFAVLAAILTWLLAHDGGPLNPNRPTLPPKAVVYVSAFDTAVYTRLGSDVHFTIMNAGDAVASRCHVRGNTLDPAEFSIPPNSSVEISEALYSRKVGVQSLSYNVVCENATSASVSKAVSIADR